MIKTLSKTSWIVEVEDTLHPNSDQSFPRLIQVVVEWKRNEFHFRPWRVIQTIPMPDGTDRVITSGLPDNNMTWDWLMSVASVEMFRWLASGTRAMYMPGAGGGK